MDAVRPIVLLFAMCTFVVACDEDPCDSRPLSEFCSAGDDCPYQAEDVFESLCWYSEQRLSITPNSCGGRSIGPEAAFAGAAFHLNAADTVIGVDTWNDEYQPDQCENGHIYYGRKCARMREETVTFVCPTIAPEER